MSKTTSLIRYKRGLNNSIMQCRRYPLPCKLRSRLRYFDIWNNKLYGANSYFFGYSGPRGFFWLFFAASRLFLPHAKKNQEKPLGPGVGRLGRSPSLLWEGLLQLTYWFEHEQIWITMLWIKSDSLHCPRSRSAQKNRWAYNQEKTPHHCWWSQ